MQNSDNCLLPGPIWLEYFHPSFYSQAESMWKDKMCPLQTTHECILLSLSLIGESRPLILKVINEICVLIVTTMWLILGIVVFSVYLCLNHYGIILIFMVSLVCSFLSSTWNNVLYFPEVWCVGYTFFRLFMLWIFLLQSWQIVFLAILF